MNAPEKATEAEFRYLPRTDLKPSPTNPRKRKGLDPTSLGQLAQSFKVADIIEPIVIREVSAVVDGAEVCWWEIVCGERRWRAAGIAELEVVPCLIRRLTDLQTLQMQLIENHKREDLDALEEAEGYKKILGSVSPDGTPYTADMIAEAEGISRSTVYARIKMLDLCQEAQDAYCAGKLDTSRGEILSRIPVYKLQLKALEEALKVNHRGEPLHSVRGLKDYVRENFMTDLNRKVFDPDDATLVEKAGACTDCHKRTGNAPELFDADDLSPNVCTDPTCFAIKKTAAIKRLQEQAEQKGEKFVSGGEAKKLIKNHWEDTKTQLARSGHVQLSDKIPNDPNDRTWNQALNQAKAFKPAGAEAEPAVQKLSIQNPHKPGEVIPAVNMEDAIKALRQAGMEVTWKAQPSTRSAEETEEEKAERAAEELEAVYRERLFGETHDKIAAAMTDPTHPVFEKISAAMCAEFIDLISETGFNDDALVLVLKRYTELPDFKEIESYDWLQQFQAQTIPTLNNVQHFLLMVDLLTMSGLVVIRTWNNDKLGFQEPERLLDFAKTCGIDPKAIKKEAAKIQKTKAAADAKTKTKGGAA